ncbi:MAG: hypothetical protein U0Y68_07645 [Blastocatellia bacterium]
MEAAGPENLRQRYALIFKGVSRSLAVAAQVVKISAAKSYPKAKPLSSPPNRSND